MCLSFVTWARSGSHGIYNQSPASHLNPLMIITQCSRISRSLGKTKKQTFVCAVLLRCGLHPAHTTFWMNIYICLLDIKMSDMMIWLHNMASYWLSNNLVMFILLYIHLDVRKCCSVNLRLTFDELSIDKLSGQDKKGNLNMHTIYCFFMYCCWCPYSRISMVDDLSHEVSEEDGFGDDGEPGEQVAGAQPQKLRRHLQHGEP